MPLQAPKLVSVKELISRLSSSARSTRLYEKLNAHIVISKEWLSHFFCICGTDEELSNANLLRPVNIFVFGASYCICLWGYKRSPNFVEPTWLQSRCGWRHLGSKTKSAIKKFYLNQGSKFDGVLDQNELLDLENAARNDGDLSARSFKDQRSEITSIEDYKSVAPSIAMNYLTEGLNPIWDL